MIVGIAVPTIERSRAARAIAAMIPAVTIAWLRVIGGIGGSAVAAAGEDIATECMDGRGSGALQRRRGRYRFIDRYLRTLSGAKITTNSTIQAIVTSTGCCDARLSDVYGLGL